MRRVLAQRRRRSRCSACIAPAPTCSASSTRCSTSPRSKAGKLELNPQTVELAPLIEEVVGTARQLAEQNKRRLVVEAQESLGTLTVEPTADSAQSPEQCLQVHEGGRSQVAGVQ